MSIIGKVINGCYKIVKKIGHNQLCDVYKLEGIYSPVELVIKIFKKPNSEYLQEELIRFKLESMYIYNISHKNIVKVLEVDELDGYSYVIMEYVDGLTIKEFLEESYELTFDNIFKIMIGITEALDAAHNSGAIHKNINVQNILIPKNRDFAETKIANFGFAELIFGYDEYDDNFFKNIVNFFPPESCSICNRRLDERSDLFSLGILFYYLLTRVFPFQSSSLREYYTKLMSKKIQPPSLLTKYKIPPTIDNIVLKLLKKEKKDRYQSAKSLLSDLEKVVRGETNFDVAIEDVPFNTNFETTLIGRDEEVNKIVSLLKEGKDSIVIYGEAGAGKSKILQEVSKRLFDTNNIIVDISANASDIPSSFYVFYEFLRRYIYIINSFFPDLIDKINSVISKNDFLDLNKILPELFPKKKGKSKKDLFIMSYSELITKDDAIDGYKKFFYEILPKDKRIILYIKNTSFLDEETTLLLDSIINDKPKNIAIIFCHDSDKEDKNSPFFKILKNKIQDSIEVKDINKNSSLTLIKDILPNLTDKVLDKIYSFINKNEKLNAYYTIEAIRALVNLNVIFPVINSWETDLSKLDNIIWKNRDDILFNKLELLKSYEIDLLNIIALYGYYFDMDTLFKISDLDRSDIVTAVDFFVTQDILEMDFYKKNHKYRINRQIGYLVEQSIDKEIKKIVHTKIATKLENEIERTIFSDRYPILAYHFEKAEEMEKAVSYYYKSALYFLDIYGYRASLLCLKKAKLLLDKVSGVHKISYEDIDSLIDELENL